MSDAAWRKQWQALAAIAAALVAGVAIAGEKTGSARSGSALGEPSLIRPSKLKIITPPGAPVGTDIRSAVEVRDEGGESIPEYHESPVRPASGHATKPLLRPARIDEAEGQAVGTVATPVAHRMEAAAPVAAAKTGKPQRIVVKPVDQPPTAQESSRRTAALQNAKSTAAEVPLRRPTEDENVSLVAAYRATKMKVSPVPVIVEVPRTTSLEYAEGSAEVPPVDAGEGVTTAPAATKEHLAPIIAAADLPRPGSPRKSPEIIAPPSLPKSPAVPSLQTAQAEVPKPAPAEKVVAEAKEVASPAPEVKKATASKVPGRLANSMQHAKALMPDLGGLKRILGTQKSATASESE